MTAAAIGIVLASALLHAGWNLAVKSSKDRLVAAWSQAAFGAAVFMPFLIAAGGPPGGVAAPIVTSAAVHTAYALSLAAAYERSDLSLAYPVARGLSPPLIAVGGVAALGDSLGPGDVAALVLIAAGLLWVAARRSVGSAAGIGWALLTGLTITAYTLIDAHGVRESGEAFRYTISVFGINTLMLTPVVALRRGAAGMWEALRAQPYRSILSGVLSAGAYTLVLVAARIAPVGLVSAVRETSVVFGALAGWLVLREPYGRRRVAGSLLVAAGLALLGSLA
jgi:drug/metabolite transporter (DMT)-like permease